MPSDLIELAEWLRGRDEFSSLLTGPSHRRGKYPKRSRSLAGAPLLWVYVEGTVPHRYAADLTDDATLGLLALQAMRAWTARPVEGKGDWTIGVEVFARLTTEATAYEVTFAGRQGVSTCEVETAHPYLAVLRAYRDAVMALEVTDGE